MLSCCPTHFQAYEIHVRKPSFVQGLQGRYTRNIFRELGLPEEEYDRILAATRTEGMNLGAWVGPPEAVSAEPLSGRETDHFEAELFQRGRLVSELMRAVCRRTGRQTWGFKILGDIIHMDVYHAVWPRAVFILLVRDPRDNAISILKLNEQRRQRRQPNFYDDLHAVAEGWKETISRTRQIQRQCPAKLVEVRYEDLVFSPEPTLAGLETQLNLDLSGAMEFHRQTVVKNHAKRFLHHSNIVKPLMQDSVGKWRTQFDESENEIFWQTAGELMEAYGYERR